MSEQVTNVAAPSVSDQSVKEAAEQVVQKEEKEKAPEIDLSARFAALARRERQAQEIERAAKEKADRLKALEEFESLKQKAKSDPLAYLQAGGIDYQLITDYLLGENQTPTQESKLEELERRLEAERQERLAREEAAKSEKRERALGRFKHSIESHIENNVEAYELIKANDAKELVFEVAIERYNEEGKVPDIKECADMVEAYLEKELDKLKALKKVQSRFAPVMPEPKDSKELPKLDLGPKTLTNQVVSQVPPQTKPLLSADESIKRAASLIRWNN